MRNLSIALAAALVLAGCGASEPTRAPCAAGKVCLEMGNGSEPISLDPHKTTGTWEDRILSDALVGLVQDDVEGKPIPGMAERWETSPDGLVWTFHLRQATWSDGVPVTADDFVYSLRRILLPQTASEYASLLYLLKNAQAVNEGKAAKETLGVRAIDPRTLEITLEHPAPYLPELAKHHTMYPVPKHVVEKWGDAWSSPAHYVSNGPYLLTAWRLGDYVEAVKNPRFYDADKVCVDQIRYYPTNDAISAERRVKRGELDINNDIQSNRIAFLRTEMPGYVRTYTYLGIAYLAFNNNVPALKDRRVRIALDMSIDRDFIIGKLLRGGQIPAYTFVPPGVANYQAAKPPVWAAWPLERRQAAARALLAQAGFGPGKPLKVEIKHRNTPDPSLFMPAVQADWKAIGVEASLAQNETQIAYAAYRSRDFEVADAAWIADYNDAMSFLYLQQSSTGSQNYGDYKNPAYDALLARADNEPDAVRRAGYLAQAEEIMLRDAPVAPVFFYVNKNLVSPKVTGWVDNIIDHHRSRYLCVEGRQPAAKG
ncbi:peptide ABC transporter substrate-binding protein [Phenylobacterium sp.]|uniref:peptide ABC transporter substrate-binding protein n=1 Tax=Phenylobacterium sp. TaxID=1871053 RepID=UPI002733EE58|nr:peptide ABC transporter substrate-binding protein [Phenylobacterium sp.]MDP3660785.1 peptide ABC transporter substrate-binding protein [Phenylobacterium sp.]